MTAPTGTSATTTRPWTPRIATQLSVLACAAFIYVTAEILPVGALSAIARNLRVSVVLVGTLLSWYALVAAVTTVPLVRWTAHWPRRRALVVSLVCLTVSQLVSALAPNFAVLAAGRVLCAVTHGLLWAVIADLSKVNRGFGPLLLPRIVASVFANEPRCRRIMFDPDHRNTATRRLCEWAGCKFLGEHDTTNRRMALYALEAPTTAA